MSLSGFFAGTFRKIIYPLVSTPLTYYPGMVLVRLSRKAREWSYSPGSKEEMKIVKFAGDLQLKVDIHSYMGGSIYWTGFHHLNEILYLDQYLKDGMTFIDVGANQGEFSVFAAAKMPHGRVLAFEPVNKIRRLLSENKQLNNLHNLEIFPFGLSDKEGAFPIYTSSNTDLHHGHHEGLSTLFKTEDRNVLEQEVALKVFDQLPDLNIKRIDFIKIDVEGAELYVLRGMQKAVEQYKPDMLLEINDSTYTAAGYFMSELLSFLEELGYVPYQIHRGKLKKMDYSALAVWGNYIFKVRSST